jgi:drug/metabolite transporter (DMT)-like permease
MTSSATPTAPATAAVRQDVAAGAAPAPHPLKMASALFAVYVIWGSTYLSIHFALEGGYPPLLAVSGGRMLLAGAVLFAILRWRGVAAPTRGQWPTLAAMGLLLMLVGNGSVVFAQQYVSSGLTAIAVASMPLWMGVFGWLFGRRPTAGEWLGIVIGFVGILWLNAGSSLTAEPTGLILLLIAPVAWAFGSVWSRGRDLPSPFMAAAGQMLCGGAMLILFGAILGESAPQAVTTKGTLALAYLAVFGSIVAFSAYVWLLEHVRPVLASSYAYINPPIAVLFGVLLAGERFTLHDLGAMVVILVGVVVISVAKLRTDRGAARKAPTAAETSERDPA